MKFLFTPFLVFICFVSLYSQEKVTITGGVMDSEEEAPVIAATVAVLKVADSTTLTGVVTDLDGKFAIPNIIPGDYLLKVQYLGYETVFLEISAENDLDLEWITIAEASHTLDEVVIQGEVTTGKQKGDTTQYNAGAFTTLPDASGQELIEKMPGVTVIDGKIQAQGEDIQQILVDGKPFFEGDIKTALQSLPADVIQSIQIYDKKSDKAELSGFDDGEEARTINIITKPDRKRGQFGKTTGGYGTDERYQVGASVNFFDNDQRITVTGLSNNINAVDYSADPNSQGESRTQDGIINTNNIALQYSNEWNDKLELSGNYQFSNRKNQGQNFLTRDYTIPSQEGQIYNQESSQNRSNQDHNFNAKLDYEIDESNRLIVRPYISLKNDTNDDSFEGKTRSAEGLINETFNESNSNNFDYDFGGSAYYSHKFGKEGRSLTLGSRSGYHTNTDRGNRLANNIYYEEGIDDEILNQRIERERNGVNWEVQGSYTEPIGERGLIELEYEVGDRIDDSDMLNFNIEEDPGGEFEGMVLDTALSNVFESRYLTQEAEIGYQYKIEDVLSVQVELEYQIADLENVQEFPQPFDTKRRFTSFLPSFRMDYQVADNKNLEVNYYNWANEPSIGQLQNVIDNSNPLQLRTGNPDLDQAINHRIRARYKSRNPETEKSFYTGFYSSIIQNNVTNSTLIANEAMPLTDEITLQKGSQLIRPINIKGYWRVGSYVSFGLPVKLIKSNFNIWGGLGHSQDPGLINDERSITNSSNFRLGLSLSSNISDRVDFNVSTRSSYNLVNNNLRPKLDNNFYVQSTRLSYKWIIWDGFTYRTDVRHRLNSGLAEDFDNSYFLVNMSFGKKMLPQERGELSLNVYDLLGQNNNINRSVTETFIEDRRGTVLQRYFMLSFTYNIRHFSKGASIDDFDI